MLHNDVSIAREPAVSTAEANESDRKRGPLESSVTTSQPLSTDGATELSWLARLHYGSAESNAPSQGAAETSTDPR